tara:strand:+ start:59 stop:670 length:612 start_codon:yes stop_codon:yes gene_type:complete
MTSEITPQITEDESSIYKNKDSFELAQRQAKSLCESNLVPISYQGQKGLPNCLVAIEMSKRMKLSPLAVMQNLNVIHGTPTWSAQFITSQILGCGRFTNFDYLIKGEGDTLEVQCVATRLEDQQIVKGTTASMRMARLEGWTRNPKYTSMPELMLRNRAATFFGRQYIPDLLLGVQTSEEVVDIQPLDVTPETVKETLDDHGM